MDNEVTLWDRARSSEFTPSIEEWELELSRMIEGERDYTLQKIGTSAYIDKILAASNDRIAASAHLHIGLSNVVRRWQPLKTHAPHSVFVVLDLIAGFQPPEGFLKIIDFMNREGRFPSIPMLAGGYGAGQDLHMKALVDLEYYYPVPPTEWKDDPPFLAYLDVLNRHLDEEQFCSYSIGRLVDLRIIEIGDPRVRQAIKKNVRTIDHIVSLLLVKSRIAGKEKELSEVYTHCFILGDTALTHFEDVLKNLGVSVNRERDGIQLELQLPGKQGAINLDLIQYSVVEVMEIGNKRGLEAVKALAAGNKE
jgi:hypothetical protein